MPEHLGLVIHAYGVHGRSFPQGMVIVTQQLSPSLPAKASVPGKLELIRQLIKVLYHAKSNQHPAILAFSGFFIPFFGLSPRFSCVPRPGKAHEQKGL